MTSKRSIIFFWALFLVPTLLMAAAAFQLLSHEQERINRSAMEGLSQRAAVISETIHLTIEAVQENLEQSLRDIDPALLRENLLLWEETHPLVRNVFIYSEDQRLIYPVRGMESTQEERRFITRYDSFFSGRVRFDFNRTFTLGESKNVRPRVSLSDTDQKLSRPLKKEESSRQKLLALSKERATQKAPKENKPPKAELKSMPRKMETSGWIPWFSENRLHILGWVQAYETGPVYGIELEMMTLLSRLLVDFPQLTGKGTALVLKDGNGNVMHQAGGLELDKTQKPDTITPVTTLLPHWQILLFTDKKGFGATRGFLYLSLILLGIFITAILSGGILLTRMTLTKIKDAREKTSFVSSVSHELKTPLTSIRMYAELLLSGRVGDEEKKQTYLGVIAEESQRLTRLINNVLNFGKLEQNRKIYRKICFQMDEFLNEMILAQQIRIKSQGLEVITRVEKGDYSVKTDRDAMEQIFLNLLDNALKYAGRGRFIRFELKIKGSFILFSICDDGPGVPKAEQERIFEKFHRVDNSLTAQQPGSGLGLSIARQIAGDLFCDLTFEPIKGNGSCFTTRIKQNKTGITNTTGTAYESN